MKNEGEIYDVLIVGAGPAGIFSALELVELDPSLRIAIVEKGLYTIGDGAGLTRGLLQASMSGVVTARHIVGQK